MKCDELIMNWLNNAYSMEISAAKAYEAYADDAENMPQIEDTFTEHADRAGDKAERVKNRIEELGGDVSKIKESIAEVSGWFGGVATELFGDKNVKNAVSSHSLAHFAHASYKAIEEAAHLCDDDVTADLATELSDESHQMADEIAENIPAVVEQYVISKTREEE